MPLPAIPVALAAIWEFCLWVGARMGVKKVLTLAAGALSWEAISSFFEEEKEEITRRFNRMIVEVVANHTGIDLDPDDPLGPGSVSRAISKKTGIPLRDVTDKETTVADFEAFALAKMKDETGYTLRSLRDREKIRADIEAIGAQIIGERTGIPLRTLSDPETIKEDILVWGEALVAQRVAGNIAESMKIKNQLGVSMMDQIKDLAGADFDPKNLIEGAKNAALSSAIKVNNHAKKITIPNRRTIQNREAQRRFRAKHGNRMKYIPIREQIAAKPAAPKPVVLKKVERPIRRSALGIPIRGG